MSAVEDNDLSEFSYATIADLHNEDTSLERRVRIDDLLTGTFNSILRTEEKSLNNRFTQGLTITEVHTIVAVGLYEAQPMNVVAARLEITLATLTIAVNKLAAKGYMERTRDEEDRRKVRVSLTTEGRKVVRAHNMFHQQMISEALEELSDEEERIFEQALTKVKHFFDSQNDKIYVWER